MFPRIRDWLFTAMAFLLLISPMFATNMDEPHETPTVIISE